MESLPTMDDLDNELDIEELCKVITTMAHCKVLWSNGISGDFLQHCKSCLFWQKKKLPTRQCWDVLDWPLFILPSVSVDFAMFWECVTSESQNLCCTASFFNGRRKSGWSTLRFKDVCKRDLKSLNVATDKWEELANDWDQWRSSVCRTLKEVEKQFFERPKMYFFNLFFVASLRLSYFSFVYFQYTYLLSTITHTRFRLTAGLLLSLLLHTIKFYLKRENCFIFINTSTLIKIILI